MSTPNETLIDLETKFWQSIVSKNAAEATKLLTEPALMVSSHGAMKFDHAGYRKMAEQGTMTLKSFELKDMDVIFPNETTAIITYRVTQEIATRGSNERKTQEMNDTSTWVKNGGRWRCVMHTETPADTKQTSH